MTTTYNLDLLFETTSGRECRWRLKGVRPDIASVYVPLVQGIIASGAFDAGDKGDLVALKLGKLEKITYQTIPIAR